MTYHYNMKAEDIIEGLNRHIETKRKDRGIKTTGHLVLQKEIMLHSSFKAYKIYKYTLWFTKKGKSHEVIVLEHTAKVLDGQEEKIIRAVDMQLSIALFEFMDTEYYDQVIKGEYYGGAEK